MNASIGITLSLEPNSFQVSSIDLSQIDATPEQIEAARKEIFTKSLIVVDWSHRSHSPTTASNLTPSN